MEWIVCGSRCWKVCQLIQHRVQELFDHYNLHMARMLQKKGYHDITILEKTDRVGGKSLTLYFDSDNHECNQGLEKPNWGCAQMEMGTCFLHNGYDRVRNFNKELSLHKELPPIVDLHNRSGAKTGVKQVQAQSIMSQEHFDGERCEDDRRADQELGTERSRTCHINTPKCL